MERYTMFLHWRSQYCENDYTTKAIYRFNAIPMKLLIIFFTELEQIIIWKYKISWMAKEILRKENEAGGVSLLDFRL